MTKFRRLAGILVELLRELSDESAYRRHLAAHSLVHSPEQWRRFSEQRLTAKFTRPKCC